jgi:predicted dehydrogenase
MAQGLRMGVLGTARISSDSLIEPVQLLGARLVAVAARDRGRAERWAAANGVERVLTGYEAVINDPEVDAVYNPLPNSFHAPWNLAAIRAGKHVLTEKPFACNATEARQVHAIRSVAAAQGGEPVLLHAAAEERAGRSQVDERPTQHSGCPTVPRRP